MKITYRKLSTGNYLGRCGKYYIFISKREHGKWDGFDKYQFWYTVYIGLRGEWLYAEGMFTSCIRNLKIARQFVNECFERLRLTGKLNKPQ